MTIPASKNPPPREWGRRWVATEARPFATHGQGTVWRVWDRREEGIEPWRRQRYALKEMRYNASASGTKFKRFVREIDQTKRLAAMSSAIVPVVDYENDEAGDLFYVMPLAEASLAKARDLRGQVERVLQIGLLIADALVVAHQEGVIHRDVKPDNVLLFGDERRPVLADFGICFVHEADRITGTNAETVGSSDFVAPELLGGGTVENVGFAADIYSLGKTLYATAAGGELFPRENHRESRWDLTVRFADTRFAHLHGLLDRMVATSTSDRFGSMTECRSELERAIENVRAGRLYTAGMYGAGHTAAERATRMRRALDEPASVARRDAVQQLLDEALTDATTAAGGEAIRTSEYETDPQVLAAIQLATEHQLGVGLPLILHDDAEFFEEWISVVAEPVYRVGQQHHRSKPRSILRAAASLTLHVAAALAWQRRRWSHLNRLMKDLGSAQGALVHLDHLQDKATLVRSWLTNSAGDLVVPRTLGIDGEVSIGLDAALGIVALVGIKQQKETDFLPFFPGVVPESARVWVPLLANMFRTRAPVERAVAHTLFDAGPEEFRRWARATRPRLESLIQKAGGSSRWVEWAYDIDPQGQWERWVGTRES